MILSFLTENCYIVVISDFSEIRKLRDLFWLSVFFIVYYHKVRLVVAWLAQFKKYNSLILFLMSDMQIFIRKPTSFQGFSLFLPRESYALIN